MGFNSLPICAKNPPDRPVAVSKCTAKFPGKVIYVVGLMPRVSPPPPHLLEENIDRCIIFPEKDRCHETRLNAFVLYTIDFFYNFRLNNYYITKASIWFCKSCKGSDRRQRETNDVTSHSQSGCTDLQSHDGEHRNFKVRIIKHSVT